MPDPREPITRLPFAPAQKPELGVEIFKLSELFARLPAAELDGPLRLDFHLVYVGLRGRGEILVDFAAAPIGAGWITAVARGRVHHYTPASRRADAWMLLFAPERVAAGGAGDPLRTSALLASHGAPALEVGARERDAIAGACERIAAEYARPLDGVQAALIAAELRALLLGAERLARASASPVPAALAPFYAALDRDVLAERSVAHYARAAGLSQRALGELLRAHDGRTTKQVILDHLVLEAKRLLAHTDVSIKALSARAGFSEPTNFVKLFHDHAGETPAAFRARFHHRSTGSHLGGRRGDR